MGCRLSSPNQQCCYLKDSAQNLIYIQVDKKKYIHANIKDLNTTPIQPCSNTTKQLQKHTFTTYKDQISKNLMEATPNLQQKLWKIYRSLHGKKALNVNINIQSNSTNSTHNPTACWTIIDTPLDLQISNLTWPSKRKALLTALLTLITAVPYACILNISTDEKQLAYDFINIVQTPTYLANQLLSTTFGIYKATIKAAIMRKDLT
ncbi:2733_t:CDS:1, partial [Ambispora leptoticha]